MKKIMGILILLGGMTAIHTCPASAEPRELSGEVVRVNAETKAVILKVDDKDGNAREVEIRLKKNTTLEGVSSLESLEEGTSVRIQAEKKPFSQIWVARRLGVVKSEERIALSPTENTDLHNLEEKAAHGEITGGEFEGRRESLKPGAAIQF